VEGIHLAQDRDRWWALVNAVMTPLGSGTTELVSYMYVSHFSILVFVIACSLQTQ
jgi:hypothetical protein